MVNYEEVRRMVEEQVTEVTRTGKLSPGSIDMLQKITDIVKNTYKIEMLKEYESEYEDEESGYSERRSRRGYSRDGGSYNDNGDSYARRGQHYVRGHYSRDDGMSERGYSNDDGRQKMMHQLRKMMEEADDDKTREAIHRCMAQLDKE